MRAALILAAVLLTGCASMPDDKRDAYTAGVADCLTTAAGLAMGLAESNPAGPVIACAVKPLAVELAARQDEPDRTYSLQGIEAIWYGASANNGALIAIKLLGLSVSWHVPVLIGVATAWVIWQGGADEREFAQACAIHRQGNPSLTCLYAKN